MSNYRTVSRLLLPTLLFVTVLASDGYTQAVSAEQPAADISKKPKLVEISLANGAVQLKQPSLWAAKKTRSSIIEREFAIPKVKGDESNGRLTMMRSGGSVKVNVERWFGQFSQPDGKSTKDVAKVTTKKINEQEVTIVDISGTFAERMGGGPFAPGKTVKRDGYRMLGGIVQTKSAGQYFFKLYGPKQTIAAAEKHFLGMLDSVKSVDKPSK